MADINTRALDRELKRGSAELLILSLLDARPRHGYELSKLIQTRSGGQLTFHIDSLYPLLYRLEERGWIKGTWVEKPDERRRRFYRVTAEGRRVLAEQRKTWAAFVRRCGASREANMPDPSTKDVPPGTLDTRSTQAVVVLASLAHARDRNRRRALAASRGPLRELIAGGASPEEAKRLALAELYGAEVSWHSIWRRCGRRMRQRQSRGSDNRTGAP